VPASLQEFVDRYENRDRISKIISNELCAPRRVLDATSRLFHPTERILDSHPASLGASLQKAQGGGSEPGAAPQSANALRGISVIGGVVRGVNLHDETIIHSRCCLLFGNRIRSERAAQTR
jgi:hypothetical protein